MEPVSRLKNSSDKQPMISLLSKAEDVLERPAQQQTELELNRSINAAHHTHKRGTKHAAQKLLVNDHTQTVTNTTESSVSKTQPSHMVSGDECHIKAESHLKAPVSKTGSS